MQNKLQRLFLICCLLFVAMLSVGCGGGGGGGSSVIPTSPAVPGASEGATSGNKVVEGYVSKSSVYSSIRANILANITNPAVNVEVEAGDYDQDGEFVSFNIKTKTDQTGKYTLTGLPANRKNIIIRAKISDNQIYENVIPFIPESKDKIIAPVIDPDTVYIAKLVRYAEQLNKAYEINVYEVMAKIPLSDLKQLQENEIKILAHKFVEKEEAQLQLFRKLGIEDEKFVKFRNFAFEIQLEIMEQVNNGSLSAEEGWKIFDQMLQLRIKTIGLSQDVIKLAKDIEAETAKKALDAFISQTTKAKFKANFYREEILAKLDNLVWALQIFKINTTELEQSLKELRAMLQNYASEDDIQKYLNIAPIRIHIKEAVWKVIEQLQLLDGKPPLIVKLYLTPEDVRILHQNFGFVPENIGKFVTSSNFDKPVVGSTISSDKISGFYSGFYDQIMKKIKIYLPKLTAEEAKALYIILFETQELGLFVPPHIINQESKIPEEYKQIELYGIIVNKGGKFYICIPNIIQPTQSQPIAEINDDESSVKFHIEDSSPKIYIGYYQSNGKFKITGFKTSQKVEILLPQMKEISITGILTKNIVNNNPKYLLKLHDREIRISYNNQNITSQRLDILVNQKVQIKGYIIKTNDKGYIEEVYVTQISSVSNSSQSNDVPPTTSGE